MNAVPSRRHVLAGLVAAPALAACNGTGSQGSSGSGSAGGQALTVGLSYIPDIQFAPFYVAKEKGYFSDAGLNVTLRHHGADEQLTGALSSGTEQVLYAGADEMMQARSQGVKVQNVATVYQSYPVVAITRQDSGITTASALKGKTLGVPGKYGETWFGLLALLKQAGLSQRDVTIQTIGFTQQAALTTKKVDAVMGYSNNEAIRLRDAGIKVNVLPVTNSLVSIGLNTMQATAESKKDELSHVVDALRKACTDINADPQSAVDLSKKYVSTLASSAQATAAVATLKATMRLIGDPAHLGRQNGSRWNAMSSFMAAQGLVKSAVPAREMYLSVAQ